MLGILVAAVPGGSAHGQEAVLLADQADGIIDASGLARIEISGIQGTLTLRPGKPGELRFACRSLDNRREERPVSLWETDSAMRLSFSDQLQPQQLLLEVAVPSSMIAVIRADESKLVINNLQGDLEVAGADLAFSGRNLGGDLDLDIQGGSVNVVASSGDVTLDGRDLQTSLSQIGGGIELRQVGGRVQILEAQGDLRLEVEQTDVSVNLVAGQIDAQATGGTLSFEQIHGGTFELSEAPVKLVASSGAIDVDTDAQVEFQNLSGTLTVHTYGGGLSGSSLTDVLQFEGSEAEVRVGELGAAASISGDRLKVQVDGVKGDLTVNTTSSDVKIADAEGRIDLTNDFGDVTVAKAAKALKIVSRDGNVEVTDLQAPVDLKADGPEVRVHWSGVSREDNSSVENAGGDVRLTFSPKGGGRLDAEAEGRIESSMPGVNVAEDGTRAAGIINRLSSPTIRVVSGGDLYVDGAPLVQNKPTPAVRPTSAGN